MRTSAIFLFLLLGAALGARVFFALHQAPSPILQFAGRMAVVEGVVADDLDARATAVRVTIAVATVNGTPQSGKVLAVLPPNTVLQYGDTVSVRGLLEEPETFETQAGRTFDYGRYLKARGIAAVMQRAVVRSQQDGEESVLRVLFQLKHTFERALERVMQQTRGALMAGLLLGEKA